MSPKVPTPDVGEPAPDFELPGSDGKTYRLRDYRGKRAVTVAWFPKAFTSGWTIECKSLRESGEAIRQFDVAHFAASIDKPEKNRKFAESLELDYPILSDPGKKTARAWGVLHLLGTHASRQAFYIDKDGLVLFIDRDVKARTAGPDMVAHLERLGIPRR